MERMVKFTFDLICRLCGKFLTTFAVFIIQVNDSVNQAHSETTVVWTEAQCRNLIDPFIGSHESLQISKLHRK